MRQLHVHRLLEARAHILELDDNHGHASAKVVLLYCILAYPVAHLRELVHTHELAWVMDGRFVEHVLPEGGSEFVLGVGQLVQSLI